MEDESLQPSVTLMNAFKHQGSEFRQDPFSFKPELPEGYQPFKFGCMADREPYSSEPIITETTDNNFNFKKDSDTSMEPTKAFTGYQEDLKGAQSILGSKLFNFTERSTGRTLEDDFFCTIKNNKAEKRFNKTEGATPQTKTSSIYQMLAEEYHNESKLQQIPMTAPKYWEDLDATNDDLLYFNTQKSQKYEPFNIISHERNEELCQKIEDSMQNIFEIENEKVSFKFIRKNIDLVLMGIPGDIFILDEDNDTIKLCNFDRTLPYISRPGLNNLLLKFERPAT